MTQDQIQVILVPLGQIEVRLGAGDPKEPQKPKAPDVQPPIYRVPQETGESGYYEILFGEYAGYDVPTINTLGRPANG